ncbi:hypothetical protein GSI_02698 [Ganoderma sinense ZZ0214-1]|uniref:Uncharacterized protein n=1 Tax=Ganoderma sinense ZZ0214-1 TaxID=1077348 RepID=A0A2G8SMC7_9APHY|nr:hypothetical protein GSI_02698 [Ganoderma sinense ZZ0214-1]
MPSFTFTYNDEQLIEAKDIPTSTVAARLVKAVLPRGVRLVDSSFSDYCLDLSG